MPAFFAMLMRCIFCGAVKIPHAYRQHFSVALRTSRYPISSTLFRNAGEFGGKKIECGPLRSFDRAAQLAVVCADAPCQGPQHRTRHGGAHADVVPRAGGTPHLLLERHRDLEPRFSWPKMRYIGLGYGLPILYALLAYVPYWIAVRGSFDISQYAAASAASLKLHSLGGSLGLNIFLLLGFGVISSISSGLGEEIGWRGFLFPSLFRLMGPTSAILISGLIWGFWHYPGILGANYNSGGPPWVAIVCFTWLVVAGAAIFGWLRVKSGSVWPAAIAHGSHNLFIQAICDPISRQDQTAALWTTEFGIPLPITSTMVALVCWLKYPPQKADSLVIEAAEVRTPAMVG